VIILVHFGHLCVMSPLFLICRIQKMFYSKLWGRS